MKQPTFSIVIANYNFGRYLETAIRSVLSQKYEGGIELIVCDAASTDNSVEIIKKYANGLPPNTSLATTDQQLTAKITWWCSESDGGQSEAFNKGFSHAQGRYLTWLNADDILLPGTLEAVEKAFMSHSGCDWATGNFIRFIQKGKRIIQATWGPHYMPRCLQGRHFPLMIFGPTTFWKREVYDRIGPIDENLHYGMDTEYWWRLTANGHKQVRVNHCCWAFRMHEASKTAEYGDHRNSEIVQKKKTAEYYYFVRKYHVEINILGRMSILLLRLVDGSMIVGLMRRLFLVGRRFDYEGFQDEN